jgi:hypothetical protein
MKPRRRMTFQLTPLLDLLLIVIFAQFMEVQQQAESAQDDLQQQKQQLVQQFDDGKAELERQRADLQREISLQSSTLTERREQYSKQFESILQQHQQAGQALSDAFNLPTTVMEEVLQLQTDGNQTDARNLQQAAKRLKDLLPQRGDELLRFMLRYDEMQKHVSVWELHLQDNGQASFSDGGTAQTVSFGTQEEFLSRAFQTSKSFTDPKSLRRDSWLASLTECHCLSSSSDVMPGILAGSIFHPWDFGREGHCLVTVSRRIDDETWRDKFLGGRTCATAACGSKPCASRSRSMAHA